MQNKQVHVTLQRRCIDIISVRVCLAILFLAASTLKAQAIISAEGVGIDRENATENATIAFGRKVGVMVREKSNVDTAFTGAISELFSMGDIPEGAVVNNTKRVSPDVNERVIISMNEADVITAANRSINYLIGLAHDLKRRAQYSLALTTYYQAYLRAYFLRNEDGKKNAMGYIKEMLASSLFSLRVELPVVNQENKRQFAVKIPIKVSYADEKMSNLWVRLHISGSYPKIVQTGYTSFVLYGDVESKKRRFMISYGPAVNADVPHSRLGYLFEAVPRLSIADTVEVEVDFSRVLNIDFSVKQINDTTYFEAKSRNISISDAKPAVWSFGDGDTAIGLLAKHFYKRRGEYTVVMKISGLEDFVRVKDIDVRASQEFTILRDSVEYVSEKKTKRDMRKEREDRIISDLIQKINQSANEFLESLERYRFKGELLFGREGDFADISQCYLFIIAKDTKHLKAVLEKGGKERRNRLSYELVKDPDSYIARFFDHYKVWIEIR